MECHDGRVCQCNWGTSLLHAPRCATAKHALLHRHRYILRRAKDGFRAVMPAGPAQAEALALAKQELAVTKRQSIVYQLFSSHVKNVLVS